MAGLWTLMCSTRTGFAPATAGGDPVFVCAEAAGTMVIVAKTASAAARIAVKKVPVDVCLLTATRLTCRIAETILATQR